MDWKLFSLVFTTMFVAELGDKTQLAALSLSAQNKSLLTVMLAVVCALSLAGVLGVLLGRVLGEALSPTFLKFFTGILFIGIGLWTLLKS